MFLPTYCNVNFHCHQLMQGSFSRSCIIKIGFISGSHLSGHGPRVYLTNATSGCSYPLVVCRVVRAGSLRHSNEIHLELHRLRLAPRRRRESRPMLMRSFSQHSHE